MGKLGRKHAFAQEAQKATKEYLEKKKKGKSTTITTKKLFNKK